MAPLAVQREIVARVETARAEIARQHKIAEETQKQAEAEVENLVLGRTSMQSRN